MARRVTRETVDGGDDVVVDGGRSTFFNPVGAIVALVLLGLLIWALFWGPIGEMFDGDGQGPKIDTPSVNK
jgi:hypothetical protein